VFLCWLAATDAIECAHDAGPMLSTTAWTLRGSVSLESKVRCAPSFSASAPPVRLLVGQRRPLRLARLVVLFHLREAIDGVGLVVVVDDLVVRAAHEDHGQASTAMDMWRCLDRSLIFASLGRNDRPWRAGFRCVWWRRRDDVLRRSTRLNTIDRDMI
jgi:hypothetical protein